MELEGDGLMVVATLQQDSKANFGHFRHVLDDACRLMRTFPQGKVTFSKQETKKAIHCLARFSLSITNHVAWFKEPRGGHGLV